MSCCEIFVSSRLTDSMHECRPRWPHGAPQVTAVPNFPHLHVHPPPPPQSTGAYKYMSVSSPISETSITQKNIVVKINEKQ